MLKYWVNSFHLKTSRKMFEAHQGVKWGSSWQRAVLGVWEDTEMKNSGDAPTLSLKNFWNFGLDNILWMPWLVGWFLLGINSKPPSSLWVSIRRRGWDPLHSAVLFYSSTSSSTLEQRWCCTRSQSVRVLQVCERGKCGTRMWLLRWSTRKPLAWPLPISLFADLGLHFLPWRFS